MEIEHRNILRRKRMVLCQSVDHDSVSKHLRTLNVLSKSDEDTLKALSSNLKKNEKLLDILPKRGPKAFPAFLEVLKANKLAHLLGDGYGGEENGNKTHDDKIIKMNEEKPVDNTSKRIHNIADTPNGDESSYDIVDVPRDKDVPMDVPEDNSVNNGDLDIASDPGGKQAKVEEPFYYDAVDTPQVIKPSDVSTNLPVVTDHNGRATNGMMINTEATDFQGNDGTDFGGKDATDSAPSSAVAQENEDGPFSLKRREASEVPDSSSSIPHSTTFDDSNCYPMSTLPRGHFLLVNNKDFLPESTMEPYPRNGTDVDAAQIAALFQELGFIVDVHRNLTCKQIMRAVNKLVDMDYSKVSAAACCFLSHGKEGVLYGIDGEIEIRDITSCFRKNKGLVGKPKMFFFQACQGSDYMDSVQPQQDGGRSEVDGPGDVYGNDISLPTEADFFYAYSTVPGYYSWRNSMRGSWFIQAIVEVFRKYAHKMDLLRMLTRVNQIVSTKKSATGQRMSHNKRQICSVVTQLRYELFLFPPHGPLKQHPTT